MIDVSSIPALKEKLHGYPFGDRVPKKIKMIKTSFPDEGLIKPAPTGLVAEKGREYLVKTNSYGAVAAYIELPSGGYDYLGILPGDFEISEWFGKGG